MGLIDDTAALLGEMKPTTNSTFYTPIVAMRPSAENPLALDCARHLRRICGVCSHCDASLKSPDPAPCKMWGWQVTPDRKAHTCRHWERRAAGGQD